MKPILRYQSGGNVQSLFIDYLPFLGISRSAGIPQQTRETSSDKSKSSNKVGLKDLLGLIKDLDGLPVDINAVENQIRSMYNNASLFSNGELSTSDLVSTYLSALRSIRMAKYNLKEYDDAKSMVTKNGGLNEVAINLHGKIYIQDLDSGEIGVVTPQEYSELLQSGGNYKVLTNSNLLYLRSHDPSFAFRNDILTTVQNGIGIDEVTQMISKIKDKIGTTELLDEGFSSAAADRIVSGINQLTKAQQRGTTIDALYKEQIITENQVREAKMALQYIWNTLPVNAKSRLRVAGAELLANNEINGDVDEIAYGLIETLVTSGLDTTRKRSITPYKQSNGSSSSSSEGGSSSSGDKSDKANPYTNMLNQDGGTDGVFMLNPGTQYSMTITGAVYGNLKDNNWNPIGNTSIADVLNKGLSGIVQNMRGISFGDKVVNPEDLNDIMYDNGGAIVVDLPSKIVNGTKVVDLDIVNQYNEARQLYDLQRNGKDDPKLLGKILSDKGLDELLDDNGLPNKNRFCRFLVISGYGVDKNEKFSKNRNGEENKFIEEIDDPDDGLIDLISTSLSTDSKKSNYEIDVKNWFGNPGDWFGNYDRIYRGNIYIPISENEIASHDAGKETLPYYIQQEQLEKYQLKLKQKNASNITGADILNIY